MKRKSDKPLPKSILTTLRGETSRERLLHRLHSVVLVLSGQSASRVARIHGDSPRAVAYWVKRFDEEGVEGLKEEQRPGRPAAMNSQQMARLQTFVEQAKRKSNPVNAETLAEFILAKFGVSLTVRQCWRILRKFKS